MLTALALIGAGLPTAASAAQTDTITGSVVLAEGIRATSTRVTAYSFDESAGRWYSEKYDYLDADGAFEIDWLEPDVEYRLELDISSDAHVDGFYAGPGELAAAPEGGVGVFSGARDLVITPLEGVSLHGTVTFAPGIYRPGSMTIEAERRKPGESTLWERSSVSLSVEGSSFDFTIENLFPGATHLLKVKGHSSSTSTGRYYHVDGLVADSAFATPVTPEGGAHIKVGAKLVEPPVKSVTAPTVAGRGAVGQTLTATPGTWSEDDASVSFQWLRDGAAISGATGSSYKVTPADRGTTVAVRVTASKDGFTPGVVTLTAAQVPVDPAARPTANPTIAGTARLGSTLRASAGTWDLAGVTASYQWLRGDSPITGATSAQYTLQRADVGKRVSVRVTGTLVGHLDGVATSSAKKVAKGKPKVTAKAKAVKAGKRAKVVVRVRAAGLAKPTGTVTVKYGKKTVKLKLAAKRKGKISVRLPQLRAGSYTVKVSFKPNAKSKKYVTKASAKKTTLRVR